MQITVSADVWRKGMKRCFRESADGIPVSGHALPIHISMERKVLSFLRHKTDQYYCQSYFAASKNGAGSTKAG